MSVDLEEFLDNFRREARVVKYLVGEYFKRRFGKEVANLIVEVLDDSFRDMEEIIEEDYNYNDLGTVHHYIDQAITDIFDPELTYRDKLVQGLLDIIYKNITKILEKEIKGVK
jgi:hypothetical protein